MSCGKNYLGEDSRFVIEFDDALAASGDPTLAAGWKPFGSINSKNYSISTQTVDNTTDSTGAVSSNLTSGVSFEATFSGYATDADDVLANQAYIANYYLTTVMNGGCPNVWLRIMQPDKIIYAYCFISSNNQGGGSKDAVTFEMAFTSTATHDPANKALQVVVVV